MDNAAVIDIGSLKTKFVIGKKHEDDIKIIYKNKVLTLLGKRDQGKEDFIPQSSIDKTIDAINGFALIMKKYDVSKVKAVTTEAMRMAKNADDVLFQIKSSTGISVDVITQEDEAKYFFHSVSKHFPGKVIAVADLGGGSVQLIIGKDEIIYEKHFFKTGGYYLNQVFTKHNPPIDEEIRRIKEYITFSARSLSNSKYHPEILIYGSTSIRDFFDMTDLEKIPVPYSSHPYMLSIHELKRFLNEILTVKYEDRVPVLPDDIYFIWDVDKALLNVLTFTDMLNINHVIPTNSNISLGILDSLF